MNIEKIHEVMLFYVNKSQQGFVTHEEIDDALDRGQMSLFNKYHANPKIYSIPGEKGSFGWGDSQRMDDALSPFKKTYTFTTGDTPGGVITLPADYMHMIAVSTTQYISALGRKSWWNGWSLRCYRFL